MKTVQQASIRHQIILTGALIAAVLVGKYCLEQGYPLVAYILAFSGALVGAHHGAFLFLYLQNSRILPLAAWFAAGIPFLVAMGLCLGYRDLPAPPLEITLLFFATGGLGGVASAGVRRVMKIKNHLSYVTD